MGIVRLAVVNFPVHVFLLTLAAGFAAVGCKNKATDEGDSSVSATAPYESIRSVDQVKCPESNNVTCWVGSYHLAGDNEDVVLTLSSGDRSTTIRGKSPLSTPILKLPLGYLRPDLSISHPSEKPLLDQFKQSPQPACKNGSGSLC